MLVKSKHNGHTPDGRRRCYISGGGGGGGSQNVTQTTTNIPKYFQPAAESLIGAAMSQLFQTTPYTDSKGKTQYSIEGMRPYIPYSANPSDYIAGFSPIQQQVQANAANLQMPGQYRGASDIANYVGAGSLRDAGTAAMAGDRYRAEATSPGAIQAYMSPYMQNVVNAQLLEAQRNADIATTQRGLQTARAGAFGGARQAIENAEAQRNLSSLQNSIVAQGQQKAFEDAQQAQQFGSTLGLQGLGQAANLYGVGTQAAGTLGDIGAKQLAGQTGILNLQNQIGGQQQQQIQNIINQAISNFAQQQEYPMQQLNQFSGLLRGYMTPGSTTTQYQAPPSFASQAAGLGLGAYGLSQLGSMIGGATGKKKGGVIKTGGIEALALRRALKGGKQ